WANASFYAEILRDCWHTRSWADKLRRWFAPPGWRPADVAARFPGEPFVLQRQPYGPPLGPARQAVAVLAFLAAMGGTLALLWFAHVMAASTLAAGALAVVGLLLAAGRACTPRDAAAGGSTAA
ncbi:MAG: fatty acid hydroxylase, partial [Burkholderiaceae bacterium]